jgi:hypothetical protein
LRTRMKTRSANEFPLGYSAEGGERVIATGVADHAAASTVPN